VLRPLLLVVAAAAPLAAAEPPSAAIDLPRVVLDGTPVRQLRVTVLDEDGTVDRSAHGLIELRGVRRIRQGDDVPLPSLERGELILTTDPAEHDLIFVTGEVVEVVHDGRTLTTQDIRRLPGWASLVPPIVAIVLSILLRDVLVALFAAVYSGAVLLWGDPFTAFLRSIDTILLGEIAPEGEGGAPDLDHATILLFTFFLGAMVAVMARSGGTAALLGRAERFATTRERGQVMTCLLGFLIFFDDYANALLVGGTMRPLTDRLKISRAKLAYLIDATAAPIAGLAIVSTWVGVEIAYIQSGYDQMGVAASGYTLFLQTLPYRFYPLYLLAFTLMIAATGRDYGSMRRAELAALVRTTPLMSDEKDARSATDASPSLVNALAPLAILLIGLVAGMAWTGITTIQSHNQTLVQGTEPIPLNFREILSESQPTRMLLLASFAAAATAVLTAVLTRRLTLPQATEAWLAGMKSMLPASAVLVLAWSIARVCDPQHLNTAGYIVHATTGILSPSWMPALAFVISGAVAFSTGSSWSTMGLLMPLFIAVSWSLMPAGTAADAPVMLGVVGAVLAGAIFGDHCSPISDTTVLSSAAADCDHVEHVVTQMPYALTVGAIALLLGYIPAGFGVSPWLLLPLGLAACYAVIRFCGRRPV
jgi:Na+/H+ antiporter NhaC